MEIIFITILKERMSFRRLRPERSRRESCYGLCKVLFFNKIPS